MDSTEALEALRKAGDPTTQEPTGQPV
jgi:hypothetical protein